jgi:GWxTD domain-containing protein
MHHRTPHIVILSLLLLVSPLLGQDREQETVKQEESEDYYQKWLNEDAIYLISDEEKAVFETLTSGEEKERFIEQFWYRRDPDPRTAANEFREEHYRRIAYANEKYTSGFPGWKTDRGRIYIIQGPPDEIAAYPSGGTYERPLNEGGGITSGYPFEIWWYRNIEGIGDNVTLEFVDRTLSGEYRLALHSEEKDALLNTPGAGLTWAEQVGLASKADRPWFRAGSREEYPMMYYTSRDNPFYRYETFSKVKAPAPVKYNDLKEMVSVNVNYSELPFEVIVDYFRLNEDQMIVPINIQIKNRVLSYRNEGGRQVARVGIYGAVSNINSRLVTEFEEDLVTSLALDELNRGLQRDSLYQKVLVLDRKQRYKLDLVAKDLASEKIGVIRKGLVPPSFGGDALGSSSIVLSDSITKLGSLPEQEEMFVLGNIKILPKLDNSFPANSRMGVYFQLYNVKIDQASFSPSFDMVYSIHRGGEEILRISDTTGDSIQFLSDQRVVIVKIFDLDGLEPGTFTVKVDIKDQLTGQTLGLKERFEVIQTPEQKLG